MKKSCPVKLIIPGIVAALVLTGLGFTVGWWYNRPQTVSAITGASVRVLRRQAAIDINLTVGGHTAREYLFDRDAINACQSASVRTREVSSTGAYEGSYRYYGVPVLSLLEGVQPEKPKWAGFDRPLDMLVVFIGADGKESYFSYGELTMCDDNNPVLLAWYREDVRPSKLEEGKLVEYNLHSGPLAGLRLVCAGDRDSSRYLDNVQRVELRTPRLNLAGLPTLQKGLKCESRRVAVWRDNAWKPARTNGLRLTQIDNWVRVGHGQGYKGVSTAKGYLLADYLRLNLGSVDTKGWYLFVACDGYTVLMSGYELLNTVAGSGAMILETLDGKAPQGGVTLGTVHDYFVDRDVWGLSHIVKISTGDFSADK